MTTYVPGYTLKGHALLEKGRPFDADGTPNTSEKQFIKVFGFAKCQCGWLSPSPQYSNRARRRIHMMHKIDTDRVAFLRWASRLMDEEAGEVLMKRLDLS